MPKKDYVTRGEFLHSIYALQDQIRTSCRTMGQLASEHHDDAAELRKVLRERDQEIAELRDEMVDLLRKDVKAWCEIAKPRCWLADQKAIAAKRDEELRETLAAVEWCARDEADRCCPVCSVLRPGPHLDHCIFAKHQNQQSQNATREKK